MPGSTVVGEICHIKAVNPRGPRYDPQQTAAERHGYDNLLLLCGKHHSVIDDDEEAYTVERLIKMKTDHEGRAVRLDDDFAETAARLLIDQSVTTMNQSGGITAHVIQAETINLHSPSAVAEANLAELRQHPLEISFAGFTIAIDKDSPLRRVVEVLVTNKTNHRLEDCRLQLEIITHDGIERPAWARFPFCEPFSLLVDESKLKPVAEYNFDEPSPNLFVRLFDEIDNKWVRREGGLLLRPGDYELCVEGLSSHAPMAHFTLRAKYENDGWAIGPAAGATP